MSYNTAVSGLDAAQTYLDTVGNNIANVNTVGFKSSNTQFADMYAASLAGAASADTTPGIGVQVADISQQFSQGSLTTTSNPLDMAIQGGGFFIVNDNGSNAYTRNGQFQMSSTGGLQNSAGMSILGYASTSTGSATTGATFQTTLTPIQINENAMSPLPTSTANLVYNLDSNSTTGYVTTIQTYDSLGNPHTLTLTFSSGTSSVTGTSVTYDVYSGAVSSGGTGAVLSGTLIFGTNGQLTTGSTNPGATTSISWGNGSSGQVIDFNFSGTTYLNSANAVTSQNINGYAPGQYSSLAVNSNGIIQASYTNGQTVDVAQVALANFKNLQGLSPQSGNLWTATQASGPALINAPGSGGTGLIQGSAVEASNVDLSSQLTDMIIAQQAYEANTQTIKTQQQDTQTLLQL